MSSAETGFDDADELLAARLRDLTVVDLDSLIAGATDPRVLTAAFADDLADALVAARWSR